MRCPRQYSAARQVIVLLLAICAFVPGHLGGHEIRPAYLEISAEIGGIYRIFWKLPIGGRDLRISPAFPRSCRRISGPAPSTTGDAFLSQWRLDCGPRGLWGQQLRIAGLRTTLTDVLVRFNSLEQGSSTTIVRPEWPTLTLGGGSAAPVSAYLRLGVAHILTAADHLLFLCALLLLVRGLRRLAITVTAFTIAHSLTLGLAVLGYAKVPAGPVEPLIALSILCCALSVVRAERGLVAKGQDHPWALAFLFGLLHGFGFVGTLTAIGLPQNDVASALLLFNLGVEVGQLTFIAAILIGLWLLRRPITANQQALTMVAAYGLGGVATFLTIERLAAMLGAY